MLSLAINKFMMLLITRVCDSFRSSCAIRDILELHNEGQSVPKNTQAALKT